MGIKLKGFKALISSMIYILGFLISFGIPVGFMCYGLYINFEIAPIDRVVFHRIWPTVLGMLLLGFVYIKWIRRIFYRKLQAIAVVDELGSLPTKSIIFTRVLKTIEYLYPAVILALIVYLFTLGFPYSEVFKTLLEWNITLLKLFSVGFFVFIFADFVKASFMRKQKIEDMLQDDAQKNKLELKRMKKSNKKALKAAELEKQLEALKST